MVMVTVTQIREMRPMTRRQTKAISKEGRQGKLSIVCLKPEIANEHTALDLQIVNETPVKKQTGDVPTQRDVNRIFFQAFLAAGGVRKPRKIIEKPKGWPVERKRKSI